jgi:hypothetical protein
MLSPTERIAALDAEASALGVTRMQYIAGGGWTARKILLDVQRRVRVEWGDLGDDRTRGVARGLCKSGLLRLSGGGGFVELTEAGERMAGAL